MAKKKRKEFSQIKNKNSTITFWNINDGTGKPVPEKESKKALTPKNGTEIILD